MLSGSARRASEMTAVGEPQGHSRRAAGSDRATSVLPWSFASIAVLPPVAPKPVTGHGRITGVIQRASAIASGSHHRRTPVVPPNIRLSAVAQGVINELTELADFLPADTPYVFDDLKLIMLLMTSRLLWMERAALGTEAEARLILIMADAVNAMWSAIARIPLRDVQPRTMIGTYERWERKFDRQMRIEIELKRARPAPERQDPTRWHA
jgi:hypothetical protein